MLGRFALDRARRVRLSRGQRSRSPASVLRLTHEAFWRAAGATIFDDAAAQFSRGEFAVGAEFRAGGEAALGFGAGGAPGEGSEEQETEERAHATQTSIRGARSGRSWRAQRRAARDPTFQTSNQLNSSETERPSWMWVMAVAICGASDRTSILLERFSGGIGMVFVTSRRFKRDALRRSMALPERTG